MDIGAVIRTIKIEPIEIEEPAEESTEGGSVRQDPVPIDALVR